jgi:hypothetical protein
LQSFNSHLAGSDETNGMLNGNGVKRFLYNEQMMPKGFKGKSRVELKVLRISPSVRQLDG